MFSRLKNFDSTNSIIDEMMYEKDNSCQKTTN